MEKIKKILSKTISWVFLATFVVIIFCVFFVDGGRYSLNVNNPIISLLIAILFGLGLFFLYRKFTKNTSKLSTKKEVVIVASALIFFMVVGIIAILFLRVRPTWDVGHIYNAAMNMAYHGDVGNEYGYISNFPFQTFLLGCFTAIIKLTSFFPYPDIVLMLFNLFCILGTILLTYLIVKKLLGTRKAIFSLILFLLFSPIILYTPIFYSDTISMLFIAGCFYLSLFLFDSKISSKKRIILSLIFGLICFCGYQTKATSIILIIALALFALFINKKFNFKKFAISTACIAIIFIPSCIIVSNISKRITNPSLLIPKTHWIMMGLKNYGGFNMEDYQDITYAGLDDGKDLASMHIEVIKQRLSEYGPLNYLGFLSRKVAFTWGDGTYYVSDKLRREPSHPELLLYKIFSGDGEYFASYNIFMNGMQVLLLVGIVIGAFFTRNSQSIIAVIKLSLLGLILFLLIWETRSRYLINYLPLMLVFFMFSLDSVSKLVTKRLATRQ
ncbi:glycosyltransferase family 39 protein [Candidatus Saccharibacteria bacterium]|nr:glycosyltransferase family 39 protein [Candidatus Saccharibacteria bacterium]